MPCSLEAELLELFEELNQWVQQRKLDEYKQQYFDTVVYPYGLLPKQACFLDCNYCVHSRRKRDQMDDVNQNPDCMNHLKFLSRRDMRRECADHEIFCISKVTNLNGFFLTIERDCTESCKEGCEEHGYGLFYTECTRCCQDSLCNEYDGRAYYRPNTSSTTLLGFIIMLSIVPYL